MPFQHAQLIAARYGETNGQRAQPGAAIPGGSLLEHGLDARVFEIEQPPEHLRGELAGVTGQAGDGKAHGLAHHAQPGKVRIERAAGQRQIVGLDQRVQVGAGFAILAAFQVRCQPVEVEELVRQRCAAPGCQQVPRLVRIQVAIVRRGFAVGVNQLCVQFCQFVFIQPGGEARPQHRVQAQRRALLVQVDQAAGGQNVGNGRALICVPHPRGSSQRNPLPGREDGQGSGALAVIGGQGIHHRIHGGAGSRHAGRTIRRGPISRQPPALQPRLCRAQQRDDRQPRLFFHHGTQQAVCQTHQQGPAVQAAGHALQRGGGLRGHALLHQPFAMLQPLQAGDQVPVGDDGICRRMRDRTLFDPIHQRINTPSRFARAGFEQRIRLGNARQKCIDGFIHVKGVHRHAASLKRQRGVVVGHDQRRPTRPAVQERLHGFGGGHVIQHQQRAQRMQQIVQAALHHPRVGDSRRRAGDRQD